jgi:hypothetical protein
MRYRRTEASNLDLVMGEVKLRGESHHLLVLAGHQKVLVKKKLIR